MICIRFVMDIFLSFIKYHMASIQSIHMKDIFNTRIPADPVVEVLPSKFTMSIKETISEESP